MRSYYKRTYGMSDKDRESMFLRQGGRCAICEKPWLGGRAMAIDHNHKTGQIRSLLCGACNLMIGSAKEDIHILNRGVDYIERWGRIAVPA